MSCIARTDHLMINTPFYVYVSHQVYQNMGAKEARKLAEDTAMYAGLIAKHLDVPKDMKIRICGIKSKRTRGQYFNAYNTILIDGRREKWSNYLDTLAHEMTHAEQFKVGRLSFDGKTAKMVWEGVLYGIARSYKKYLALPWEREARKFGAELSQLVLAENGDWEKVGMGHLARSSAMMTLLEKDKDKFPEMWKMASRRIELRKAA